jgi:hypothetical protein
MSRFNKCILFGRVVLVMSNPLTPNAAHIG